MLELLAAPARCMVGAGEGDSSDVHIPIALPSPLCCFAL